MALNLADLPQENDVLLAVALATAMITLISEDRTIFLSASEILCSDADSNLSISTLGLGERRTSTSKFRKKRKVATTAADILHNLKLALSLACIRKFLELTYGINYQIDDCICCPFVIN